MGSLLNVALTASGPKAGSEARGPNEVSARPGDLCRANQGEAVESVSGALWASGLAGSGRDRSRRRRAASRPCVAGSPSQVREEVALMTEEAGRVPGDRQVRAA